MTLSRVNSGMILSSENAFKRHVLTGQWKDLSTAGEVYKLRAAASMKICDHSGILFESRVKGMIQTQP